MDEQSILFWEKWEDDSDLAKIDPFDPLSWPREEQGSLRARLARDVKRQKDIAELSKLISDRWQPQPMPIVVPPGGRPLPLQLPKPSTGTVDPGFWRDQLGFVTLLVVLFLVAYCTWALVHYAL